MKAETLTLPRHQLRDTDHANVRAGSRPAVDGIASRVLRRLAKRASASVHGRALPWCTDEVIARTIAQNSRTWEMLRHLGVCDGDLLALRFVYETAGHAADCELADFLCSETDYRVTVEPDGVVGRTSPLPVSPATLDSWVEGMVLAGHDYGGCRFDGWTATIARGADNGQSCQER